MSGNLIKSGTHQVVLTAETYDSMICGTVTTHILQRSLVANATQIVQVVVQASNDNAAGSIVYVGDGAGCYIELVPGASISIPVNDLHKVCMRGTAIGLVVNYLAVR